MLNFTKLELGALSSIFAETPERAGDLQQQLEKASVVSRENTGGGFFTTISVPVEVPPMESPRVLGNDTTARVDGLVHGMGFVLFIEKGHLNLLEGYAISPEDTTPLNLESVNFTFFNPPID